MDDPEIIEMTVRADGSTADGWAGDWSVGGEVHRVIPPDAVDTPLVTVFGIVESRRRNWFGRGFQCRVRVIRNELAYPDDAAVDYFGDHRDIYSTCDNKRGELFLGFDAFPSGQSLVRGFNRPCR